MQIFTGFNQINKSILNYAAKRGIQLEVDTDSEAVLFWDVREDCEWMFSYGIGACDWSLVWRGNIYLPDSVKEELPAHIMTAAKLKEVIEFISVEMKLPRQ
ncbi:hypothetical protein CDG24_25260 [Salmonella enterica subsp. enterica serovar Newport]|nr:hypothetical protein [Salmonella enterica subsp. enterica serovar Newport]